MTKEAIKELLTDKKNANRNFCITTDIAVGHGAAGVSYKAFTAAWENEETKYGRRNEYYSRIISLEFREECLVVEHEVVSEARYKCGRRKFYIPYERIVSVEVLFEDCAPGDGRYPYPVDVTFKM